MSLMSTRIAFATSLLLFAAGWSAPAECQTLTVLHAFTGGADGSLPGAGLTIDQRGRLYGTDHVGGDVSGQFCAPFGCGVAFQLTNVAGSWVLAPIYTFGGGNDGASPTSTLVFGPDGALYGTTIVGGGGPCDGFSLSGCGTVFSLRPPARACARVTCPWLETVLYRFTGAADGAYPSFGAVVFDRAGNLYGTTRAGGRFGQGAVYELSRSAGGWTESTLYSFTGGSDGSTPFSGVVFDSAGNLYGTTFQGGAAGDGTVFELTPSASGWNFNLLYTFTGGNDGRMPWGGLTLDASGSLFGSTSRGGGAGTVFQLTLLQGTRSFRTIYSLESYPSGTLALDEAGNLYGETVGGGRYANGTVFQLSQSGGNWVYTDLHDFYSDDGVNPFGDTLLSNGTVYGVTEYGGPNHCEQVTCGVAWELRP